MKSVKNKLQEKELNQHSDLKNGKREPKSVTCEPDNISQSKKYVFGKEHPPFSYKNIKEIIKEIKITRSRMRLVCMFNQAGKPELFTVDSTKTNFTFLGGSYIIPNEDDPVEINSGLQLSFYHQGISSPISLRIPVDKLKNTADIEDVEVLGKRYSIEYALNPELVKKFMLSQIIEKTMQGQDMQEIFSKQAKMTIILIVICAVTLLILLNYTGILSNIPFL